MEGTPFGRYRLIELLGRGGMGEVWRAQDTAANNRNVAIKMLPPHMAQDQMFVQRFRREADAAAKLNNPHIIPIHNYGDIDGRLYVDMRLVDGRDLQQVLADGGPLNPARAVRIIEQVAVALHAAHKAGLVHRDVKPSNILIDENDFAYLIDFGIARDTDETGLTGTGNMIGSWHYMAPERFRPGDVDGRVDIYALACVLYECLTGTRPFPGDLLEHQIAAHLTSPPPQPSTTKLEVPEALDEVIAMGMAKDPGARYGTTVELANAAQDAITTPIERPTEPEPAPPTTAEPIAKRSTLPRTRTATTGAGHTAPPGLLSPGAPTQHHMSLNPPQGATTPSVRRQVDQAPTTRGPGPRWWRRRSILISAAALLSIAVIVAVIAIKSSSPRTEPATQPRESAQVVLPFIGLGNPYGVAIDAAGNVYVADHDNNRVLKLAGGKGPQIVMPFTDLDRPTWVAVDGASNVYVSEDNGAFRVLKLAGGTGPQTVLPFDLIAEGMAADAEGNLYVADEFGKRVLKSAGGTGPQTVLPFTDLGQPYGVAVDVAGNVYVVDNSNERVLKLADGTGPQTVLQFSVESAFAPRQVAVDTAGNAYLTQIDSSLVLKLASGTGPQTVLPFTGLKTLGGVAVDVAGNVYVADRTDNRVVKLAAS